MRFFKTMRQKNSLVKEEDAYEQRQQHDEYEEDDINDDREIVGTGSELAEEDQFEIYVPTKAQRNRASQNKKKYMVFLSTPFGKKGQFDEDDSTVSSITTEGKRRLRLLQAGLYQVAASTGGSWFFTCCHDSSSTVTPSVVQPPSCVPVEQSRAVEYAPTSLTSFAKSAGVETADINRSAIASPRTFDNTMLGQTSFQVNSQLQQKYIQRKEEEKVKLQHNQSTGIDLVQFLFCGTIGSTDKNQDGSLSSAANKTRGSSLTHNTAATNPTALFDTLSEDEADDTNNGDIQHQQQYEQRENACSEKSIAGSFRSSSSKLLQKFSSVTFSKSGKKFLKGSFLRPPLAFRNRQSKKLMKGPDSSHQYLVNEKDLLPTMDTRSSLLDESIIIQFNSSYVDPSVLQQQQLIPPPPIPLKRANEIQL